jgi:AraC family transcriptional regulator
VYPPGYFESFQPEKTFVKWAALQVDPNHKIPSGMEKIIIESGLYAVFQYKGLSNDAAIFLFIFNSWLPGSE